MLNTNLQTGSPGAIALYTPVHAFINIITYLFSRNYPEWTDLFIPSLSNIQQIYFENALY